MREAWGTSLMIDRALTCRNSMPRNSPRPISRSGDASNNESWPPAPVSGGIGPRTIGRTIGRPGDGGVDHGPAHSFDGRRPGFHSRHPTEHTFARATPPTGSASALAGGVAGVENGSMPRPKLSDAEVEDGLAQLPGWAREATRSSRSTSSRASWTTSGSSAGSPRWPRPPTTIPTSTSATGSCASRSAPTTPAG